VIDRRQRHRGDRRGCRRGVDAVSKFVPKSNIVATTNCGMAPMHRDIAEAKLMALGAGRNWHAAVRVRVPSLRAHQSAASLLADDDAWRYALRRFTKTVMPRRKRGIQ